MSLLKDNPVNSAIESSDDVLEAIVKLSGDIGEMANRIGDMADRILETQRIQSENLKVFQDNSLEMARILSDQLKSNQDLMARIVDKLAD